MADRAKTAINPSDQESTGSAMLKLLRDFMLSVDDCLPAVVVSYDRVNNTAVVKPIITRLTVDDESVPRNQVVNVNVFSFGGGKYLVNFPLAPGDLGWIKASDRDLSKFRESLKESPPASSVSHAFDSSMFFPDVFRQYVIQGEHSDEAVFQTADGQNRVAIGRGRVKVATGDVYVEVTPAQVTVKTPILVVDSPDSRFLGKAEFADRVTMVAGFSASGGATSSVDKLTVAGTPVEGHDHEDPQGGRTGPFGG